MSGHFVLDNITSREIEDIQNAWNQDNFTVPVLGALQHGNIGWNPQSIQELQNAYDIGIVNRNNLPPHKYLDFGVNQIGNHGIAYLIQNRADNGWVTRLKRPNMGLTALSANALSEWNLHRLRESFVTQLRDNGATLEIYHLDGQNIQ